MLKLLQRVQIVRNAIGYTVPPLTKGRVVMQNHERSSAGYDTHVVWYRKCGKSRQKTWIPETALRCL